MRLLLLLLTFSCSLTAAERLPNFVVIFCDDLGYGDLACYGNPTIKTPNLDRMARQGQKWTQFYVADPVCTPSRAALLTGRYPIRNGMSSAKRAVLFPDSARGLPPSEITIAEVLKRKGYATAAVGKWHLGHLPKYLPTNQGFDSYYGIPYSNDMDKVKGKTNYKKAAVDPYYYADTNDFNVPLLENEMEIERPANQNTITRRYTERAVAFIEKNQERPFFLYLAHSMPHIPLFTSKAFREKSKRGVYGDVIEEIDWSVGRILKTIRDKGLEKDTVVVFTSDNGPWLAFQTHGGSAGPLRAGKGTTFEGGQRVPTLFWGPGYVKSGVVSEMGSTLDLMPTFAALAGAEPPQDRKMDGFDLSEVLKSKSESPRRDFHYWTKGTLHAVRSGPWKLHVMQREPVNYGKQAPMDGPELYHLENDISEAYDVAADNPEIVERLLAMISAHEADTADSLPDQLAERIVAETK
ncbi:sulfatase family protein [Pelagicoccus mobilis]|uniref:Sulfatase n=1 Tax=Pelagicoccus mobilis TaxID=415221 RepID=A0A934S2U8_9BACT|nr:sulfatase [Pelagicoccus mobilis]MBK1880170.1 sulfatase [Pelagicoccus mobilis]